MVIVTTSTMNGQNNAGTATAEMNNDHTIESSNLNLHQSSSPISLTLNATPTEEEANA